LKELAYLIPFLMLVIAFLGYQLNKQKETKSETRQDARIQVQLEYIGKGVDDIKFDLKASERQMGVQSNQIARVDEAVKSLHKRVDKLEGKGEVLHG
jgi:hypothetical protein